MNRHVQLRGSAGLAAYFAVGAALSAAAVAPAQTPQPGPPKGRAAMGPLRKHPDNGRYFADAAGKAVLLVGSHTWSSLVDIGPSEPPPKFDFDAYLDFLERHGHNFIRLWTWEPSTWDTKQNPGRASRRHTSAPQPWARGGRGKALDGKPKFDLTKYDGEYFRRLRSRVEAARKRGIYVSVMLFEGWAMQFSPGAWESHPFHRSNNVNGINGDADGDGKGLEVHELADKAVTAVQEAYVRKVVDTVNDLDNVLYEISNENHPASTKWQVHMIDLIHRVEKSKPFQHPVGMTFQYRGGKNKTLFDSPADWVSPNPEGGYRDNPPAATGRKVVLTDTDHLWGIDGNRQWVWKSFLRGMNPIFMDPYDCSVLKGRYDPDWVEPIRKSMGYTMVYAKRMNLLKMVPENELASSAYCLAEKGREYLVYLPEGNEVTVNLTDASHDLKVEWFNPNTGETVEQGKIKGGHVPVMKSPFGDDDAVLYLK